MFFDSVNTPSVCRSPYGERGLKWVVGRVALGLDESLSLRRAWIEMTIPPAGTSGNRKSLSLRRAWIEISAIRPLRFGVRVALLTESVD